VIALSGQVANLCGIPTHPLGDTRTDWGCYGSSFVLRRTRGVPSGCARRRGLRDRADAVWRPGSSGSTHETGSDTYPDRVAHTDDHTDDSGTDADNLGADKGLGPSDTQSRTNAKADQAAGLDEAGRPQR